MAVQVGSKYVLMTPHKIIALQLALHSALYVWDERAVLCQSRAESEGEGIREGSMGRGLGRGGEN